MTHFLTANGYGQGQFATDVTGYIHQPTNYATINNFPWLSRKPDIESDTNLDFNIAILPVLFTALGGDLRMSRGRNFVDYKLKDVKRNDYI